MGREGGSRRGGNGRAGGGERDAGGGGHHPDGSGMGGGTPVSISGWVLPAVHRVSGEWVAGGVDGDGGGEAFLDGNESVVQAKHDLLLFQGTQTCLLFLCSSHSS